MGDRFSLKGLDAVNKVVNSDRGLSARHEKQMFIKLNNWHNQISLNSDWNEMKFDTLVRYKALDQVYSLGNRKILDHFLDQENPIVQEQLGTRKIQFDASAELFKDLEEVVSVLDMSKREFLESAVSDALQKAHQIISEEEVIENMQALQALQENTKC